MHARTPLTWDRVAVVRDSVAVGLVTVFLGGVVWLSFGQSVAFAQADSTHYQTLQLGERSRGMAAAYTGFAGDGAAIWFNPAGLPLLEAKLLHSGP